MSFLFKSKTGHPEKIGSCRIIKKKGKKKQSLEKILSLHSEFCKGKSIKVGTNPLGSGSFGIVFPIKIEGINFALKILDINLEETFVEKEKEVGLSNLLSEVRRRDGQRICVPIYDCFFICETFNENSCLGEMFYIMEYGNNNMSTLFKRKTGNQMFDSLLNCKLLFRDGLVKMMENIDLFIRGSDMINIDTKPNNSVFNFKEMKDTGLAQINPIIIDLDENFCFSIDDNIIDFDKLNKILMSYEIEGKPIKKKKNL